MRVSCRPDEAPFPLAYLALPPPPSDLTLPLTPPLYFTPAPLTSPQVMKKKDLIRKNMVESVNNERNILALANNPFVVSGGRLCAYPPPPPTTHTHLHVAVDDALRMAVLERKYSLRDVLPSDVLIQGAKLAQQAAVQMRDKRRGVCKGEGGWRDDDVFILHLLPTPEVVPPIPLPSSPPSEAISPVDIPPSPPPLPT